MFVTNSSDPRPLRFAESDTRRWVLIGAALGALCYALLAVVSVASFGFGPTAYQLVLVGTAAVCVSGALLAYRQHVFPAGVVALSAVGLEASHSLYSATAFPSVSLLTTAVIIIASTLLLKPRHSLLVALLVLVGTWPLVLLSPAVQLSGVTGTVLYWLVSHAVTTIAVWSLISLGFSTVDRAFAEVIRQERELTETIDRAPDGILITDSDDVIRVANPAALRLLRLDHVACVGQSIALVLQPADVSGGCPEALKPRDSGDVARTGTLFQGDGRQVELEISWRSMDGGRRQFVLRDVSERLHAERVRREMELQLSHAQRLEAVGQLAGGIAHDFNNILTIVGGAAEVLRAEMPADPGLPLLDEILSAQERGATLTRQLLAFARRDVVHLRVFDLSQQVLGLRRLLQRVAGEGMRLSCDVEPDCRVRADVGQVEQALVNLVSNARDAMPDGGTCTLRVVRMTNDDDASWVRLQVSDCGMGMDEATRARAFEPFFTTKPRGRGTGLGLSAVHGMMLQSGGRADITSSIGTGTIVNLEFPFAAGPASPPVERSPSASIATGGTILVAEDDDGTRAAVARILERLGYSVLLAPDGQQALRLLHARSAEIDLVITDVMMPGLTGPQLALRMRTAAPQIPVLFMSGYPEDALTEVDGLSLETDFIAKPFSSAALMQRVSAKLASRGSADALR